MQARDQEIFDSMGLSISELARILDVSKQALSNGLKTTKSGYFHDDRLAKIRRSFLDQGYTAKAVSLEKFFENQSLTGQTSKNPFESCGIYVFWLVLDRRRVAEEWGFLRDFLAVETIGELFIICQHLYVKAASDWNFIAQQLTNFFLSDNMAESCCVRKRKISIVATPLDPLVVEMILPLTGKHQGEPGFVRGWDAFVPLPTSVVSNLSESAFIDFAIPSKNQKMTILGELPIQVMWESTCLPYLAAIQKITKKSTKNDPSFLDEVWNKLTNPLFFNGADFMWEQLGVFDVAPCEDKFVEVETVFSKIMACQTHPDG